MKAASLYCKNCQTNLLCHLERKCYKLKKLMTTQNQKTVSVLFDERAVKQLDRCAADRELTRAALIRLIVKCWLKDNLAPGITTRNQHG